MAEDKALNNESLDKEVENLGLEEGAAPTEGATEEVESDSLMDDVELDFSALEEALDTLPDEEKAFLAAFMTPEFAQTQRMIYGEQAGQFFQEISNPDIILVPMRRSDVETELEGMRQEQAASPQQGVGEQPAPSPEAGQQQQRIPPAI